jgi:hypothetical protein
VEKIFVKLSHTELFCTRMRRTRACATSRLATSARRHTHRTQMPRPTSDRWFVRHTWAAVRDALGPLPSRCHVPRNAHTPVAPAAHRPPLNHRRRMSLRPCRHMSRLTMVGGRRDPCSKLCPTIKAMSCFSSREHQSRRPAIGAATVSSMLRPFSQPTVASNLFPRAP